MANPISDCITSVATNLSEKLLVDPIVKEAHHFCCYGTYVENFRKEREDISAKRRELELQIDDAGRRNQTRIKPEVQQWRNEADGMITEDIETKKKCFFDWCPNCIWQYKRGKALEKKTLRIGQLKESFKSVVDNGVARSAELPSNFYIKNFVEIKSRESEFNSLVEALKDESCFMVGLHGMGGTGKTTMAKQVANKVEESKVFSKVIFVVVSTPPNFKNMRDQIGKHLLEEGMEAKSETLLKRIVNYEGKLLIILDDVWEEFDLTENVGIPSQGDKKSFTVLITTRDSKVCGDMGCKPRIQLQTLHDEEALNLFMIYADKDGDSCNEFKPVAKEIVGKCGGLPVAIVALASALKPRPIGEWKLASTALQKAEQLRDVPEGMKKVYKSLTLSYDKLNKEEAKELLLLCSLFPADTEIRVEDLIRFGIGLGLFGEVDQCYAVRRNKVSEAKRELLDSSLLLEGEEENCVKMHDLVREVALWMKKKGIQAVVDSKTTLKGKLQYLWWKSDNDDFPNQLDHLTNLEILLLWIDRKDGLVELPNEFFAKMKNLKVFQFRGSTSQTSAPSLHLESLQPLKDIRSLILSDFVLGDISILGNLPSLETLELEDCSISELPKEIKDLTKLKLLGLRGCEIKRNNPFEVIEACPELEELYFVENKDVGDWRPRDEAKIKDAVVENRSPPKLQRYHVRLYYSDGIDGPISRCFNSTDMKHLISEVTFNDLVKRAEILVLESTEEEGWRNVIPDAVPINNEEMDNLVNLSLNSSTNIKCLVDTNPNHNMTAFSKLRRLSLYDVDVEELYSGVMPRSFLMELNFLSLWRCKNFLSVLFKGDYKLCHLKIMRLSDCPRLKSIFQASSAQSLEQLEELKIDDCSELEYIIEGGDAQQSGGAQLFPKLETLKVEKCDKLGLILPFLFVGDLPLLKAVRIEKCVGLKYIFGEYKDEKRGLNQNEQEESMLPSLEAIALDNIPNLISIFREGYKSKPMFSQMPSSSASRNPKPTTSAFSWPNLCCFLPTTKRANDVVSKVTLPDPRISQELHPWVQTHTDECLIQTLNLKYLKKITLDGLHKLKWVFTLSIATSILVEELVISGCHGLENIIRKEEEHDQMNCCSIFPKLEELSVYNCSNLEIMFPSPFSARLEKLKSLDVMNAPALICVFWECQLHNNDAGELPSNDELHNHLPALDYLYLEFVPKMISVCSHQAAEELFASVNRIQTFLFSKQSMNLTNIKKLNLRGLSSLKSLFTPSIATSMIALEELGIHECDGLKHIVTMLGEDHHHLHHPYSIFPKLESLEIYFCRNLEIMFPSTSSVVLEKLKIVRIYSAPQLKYIFGKYDDTNTEDYISSNGNKNNNNIDDELHINLPALEELALADVPDMMGFYGSKSQLHKGSPSMFDFMVCSHTAQLSSETTQESLESNKETLPLSAAQCPSRQPLNLSLHNIKELKFCECSNIISLFTPPIASTMKMLDSLVIRKCCNLQCIVADEGNAQDHVEYDSFFPNMKSLEVSKCQSLKFVFPVQYSFRSLKHLETLSIMNAPQLNYVFGTNYNESLQNQNDQTQVLVLPALHRLSLEGVPDALEKVIVQGKPLSTDSKIIKSNDHEGTSKEFEAEIPSPTLEMQPLPTSLTEIESSRPSMNNGKDSIPEGITSLIHSEHRHSQLGSCIPSLKEKGKEVVGEFSASNLSVPPHEISPHSTDEEEMAKELECTSPSNLITKPTSQPNSTNQKQELTEVEKDLKFSHETNLVIQSAIETTEREGQQEHYATEKVLMANNDLDSRKQYIVPLVSTLDKESTQSTNHEGTLKKFEAEILSPTMEMQPLPTSLTELESTAPSINSTQHEETSKDLESTRPSNLITKPTSEPNSTNQQQALAEVEKDIKFSHEINLTVRETKTSVEAGHDTSLDLDKDNMVHADVIASPHHQSEIGVIGPSTAKNNVQPILGIGEIFQLVELKDGEAPLLAKALEQYPQLRLPRQQRTDRIISLSYRVLIDILVVLATKTPSTITTMEKVALQANLDDATILGFDKDWIETIRAKVFQNDDMSDVNVVEKEILDAEAKLESYDLALEHVHKQRAEVKECLAKIDGLLSLLEDRMKLVMKMKELKEIKSSRDKPFGF